MKCPHCDGRIILGDDECSSCGEDLTHLGILEPERGRIHEMILADPLSRLNAPQPLVLREDDSVALAVARMKKLRYGSVLIVDEFEHLRGIFTEHDLVERCCGREGELGSLRLADVMTPQPETLTEVETLAHALHCMSVGGYRHVPLVNGRVPIGFVSIRGILKYIARNALGSDPGGRSSTARGLA